MYRRITLSLAVLACLFSCLPAAIAQDIAIVQPPAVRNVVCWKVWGKSRVDGVTRWFCCAHTDSPKAHQCAIEARDREHDPVPGLDDVERVPCDIRLCPTAPEDLLAKRSCQGGSCQVPYYEVVICAVACNGESFPIAGKGVTYCEALEDAKSGANQYATALGLGGIRCYRVIKVTKPACPSTPACKKVKRCRLFR